MVSNFQVCDDPRLDSPAGNSARRAARRTATRRRRHPACQPLALSVRPAALLPDGSRGAAPEHGGSWGAWGV
jgi:hypothetical protein